MNVPWHQPYEKNLKGFQWNHRFSRYTVKTIMTRCHRIYTESGSKSSIGKNFFRMFFWDRYHLLLTLGVGNIDQKLLYKKIRKSLYNLGSYHKNSLWVIFLKHSVKYLGSQKRLNGTNTQWKMFHRSPLNAKEFFRLHPL